MHHTMKMTLAALASLALLPTAVSAHMVHSPHAGTVTATTYYSSGAFHGAVDIAPAFGCGADDVQSPFAAYWTFHIASTSTQCTTPNQNEARHLFSDGWTFRVWHFIKSPTYDGPCSSCVLGKTGNHTHLQYDKSGTKDTSWYGSYTVKGEFVDRTETLGVLPD